MADLRIRNHSWNLDEPFWRSNRIFGESLFFIRKHPDEPARAQLLFKPSGDLQLTSASREIQYRGDLDYVVDSNTRTVELTPASRIPFTDRARFYPGVGEENSIAHKLGADTVGLFFGEGHYFHDLQVEASYGHESTWQGAFPGSQRDLLQRTVTRLKEAAPLKICVMGDSISAGWNASGFTGAGPGMPPYPELWVEELRRIHGGKMVLKNFAVAGKGVEHGLEVVDTVLAEDPGLVVVAYGMNNVSYLNPGQFLSYTAGIVEKIKIKSPEIDLILVASMLGNPEWHNTPTEPFFLFRDALESLCGPGVALADLTQVWADLLKLKPYHDLTGNGVNHPNDFGHRIYAQVLLELLGNAS